MSVDINLLKQLRDQTQAPLKDCKEVLVEAEWDIEKAKELLKKKWALQAAKKADRDTNEWLVKIIKDNNKIIWIKVACETDFVAKNDLFLLLLDQIIDVLKNYNQSFNTLFEISEEFLTSKLLPLIQESIWRIWENLKLVDAFISDKNWYIYTHPWSKVASVVYYESNNWVDESVAKDIALQVAAMNPEYFCIEDVPQNVKDTLKETFLKEMEWSNKPIDILEKIIDWKFMKSYSENVLLEQLFIKDETKKIKEIIPSSMKLIWYKRLSV